jgi:predicted dehydrogenase
MDHKIGVGIIGGSVTSWAAVAHIPALKLLDGFELVAVSTTNQASAQEAAIKFGFKHAFDNEHDLVSCPEVDLVVISVKVPHHYRLAKTAIEGGKMLYCEWPLGNGTTEATELTTLAESKGVRTFVGLQAVSLPETRYLKKVIDEGLIGDVLSSSILASGGAWGASLDKSTSYVLDPANGVTMLDVPFGHTISAFVSILGDFATVSAVMARRRTETVLFPDTTTVPQLTKDQLAVMGILEEGAVANLHYRGGMSAGINFHWEINGTKGDIVLTSDEPGAFEMINVKIEYAPAGEKLRPLEISDEYFTVGVPVQPIHGMYYALKAVQHDIVNGSKIFPSFADGLRLHNFLDLISRSANEGQTLNVQVPALNVNKRHCL